MNLLKDERIPSWDKKVLLGFVILIVSPIDFINDWVPLWGKLDDLIFISMIFDYFFRVLDSQLVLSHYQWGMKSFARIRAIARFLEIFVPKFLTRSLWKYRSDPYV